MTCQRETSPSKMTLSLKTPNYNIYIYIYIYIYIWRCFCCYTKHLTRYFRKNYHLLFPNQFEKFSTISSQSMSIFSQIPHFGRIVSCKELHALLVYNGVNTKIKNKAPNKWLTNLPILAEFILHTRDIPKIFG